MNRRDVLLASACSAILVAMLLPIASIGVDQHHDGIMLKPALDVLAGQCLFRDTFTQYGALTTYLQALALAINPTLLALRLATVGVFGATLFCLYAAWRLILPRSLTAIACLLFILFIPAYETEPWNHEYWLLLPWSSGYAMLFQAVGLYALFRVIRGEQPERWGFGLGLASAAAFWCRQPVGVMMAASLVVIWPALLWTGWTPGPSTKRAVLGRILAGYFTVHAVLFGGLALNGALPAWWEQNILWPARWSQAIPVKNTLPLFVHPGAAAGMVAMALALLLPDFVKRFRPDLAPAVARAYFAALAGLLLWQHERVLQVIAMQEGGWSLLIPAAVVGLALVSLVGAIRPGGIPRPPEYYLGAAWAVVGLGSLTQYYPMGDSWHIAHALAPVFGLAVFAAWRWSGRSVRVVAVALAVVLLPAVYFRARSISPALNRPLVTLVKPAVLRGMKVPPEQARAYEQIANTVALAEMLRPGIAAALIGDNALYLGFVKNPANPIAYYVTWLGLAREAENQERWAYIHRTRPLMIMQKARWEAVDEFYRGAHYLPVLYVPAEDLEIAFPQELADGAGLKIYGLYGLGRAKPKTQP